MSSTSSQNTMMLKTKLAEMKPKTGRHHITPKAMNVIKQVDTQPSITAKA